MNYRCRCRNNTSDDNYSFPQTRGREGRGRGMENTCKLSRMMCLISYWYTAKSMASIIYSASMYYDSEAGERGVNLSEIAPSMKIHKC
jgi:hypothetical protein